MFRRLNHCAVPGYSPICMDTNDPHTVECAFKQRLLRDVPAPKPGRLLQLRAFVRAFCRKNLPRVPVMEFEDWLASTTYTEERKNELRRAHDELRGGRPTRKQCSHVDTFGKSEFYDTLKHLRLINSRSDFFKVFAGPRFKAIEDVLYELDAFIKHTPVRERAAKIRSLRYAGRRYFQTDFTAFESHFTPDVLRAIECELYNWCLQDDADCSLLMNTLMGWNKMRTKSGCSAEVKGRRMSGDMCTSLGNGFTNLMLALFLVHEKGGTLEGFVEGDDGLFSTDVPLTKEDYEHLGFTIKVEEIDDPCKGSFCGMIFSESGEIIRNPRKFVQGFGWTQSFISAGPRIMDELLRAKALSTVYETPQCPIVGAFARYALAKTKGVSPRFVLDGYHQAVPRDASNLPAFAPSSDTRELFEEMYNIPAATQIAIEEAVARGDFDEVSSLMPPTWEQADFTSKYVIVT